MVIYVYDKVSREAIADSVYIYSYMCLYVGIVICGACANVEIISNWCPLVDVIYSYTVYEYEAARYLNIICRFYQGQLITTTASQYLNRQLF